MRYFLLLLVALCVPFNAAFAFQAPFNFPYNGVVNNTISNVVALSAAEGGQAVTETALTNTYSSLSTALQKWAPRLVAACAPSLEAGEIPWIPIIICGGAAVGGAYLLYNNFSVYVNGDHTLTPPNGATFKASDFSPVPAASLDADDIFYTDTAPVSSPPSDHSYWGYMFSQDYGAAFTDCTGGDCGYASVDPPYDLRVATPGAAQYVGQGTHADTPYGIAAAYSLAHSTVDDLLEIDDCWSVSANMGDFNDYYGQPWHGNNYSPILVSSPQIIAGVCSLRHNKHGIYSYEYLDMQYYNPTIEEAYSWNQGYGDFYYTMPDAPAWSPLVLPIPRTNPFDMVHYIPGLAYDNYIDPGLLSAFINNLWANAAVGLTYSGLKYPASSPITASQVQQAAAIGAVLPTIEDGLSPMGQTVVDGVATDYTYNPSDTTMPVTLNDASVNQTTAPVTNYTNVTSVVNNYQTTNNNTTVDFGPDPGVGSPTLDDTPDWLAPLLTLFPSLRSALTLPSHTDTCPTATLTMFGYDYTMDVQCTIAEAVRSALGYVMVALWSFLALFRVLSA